MDDNGCKFGAELSGHLFFDDFRGLDNPDIALLYMLKVVLCERKNKINIKFSEIFDKYKKYFKFPEVNLKVDDSLSIFKTLEDKFFKNLVSKIDGLSFDFGDWWFNIRKSNTEELVRINLEAVSRDIAEEKLELLKDLILN